MSRNVARLGDNISHGGRIVSASGDTLADGIGVARVGDSVVCDIHGTTTIVNGAEGTLTNGIQTARIGDSTACGAVITSGSPQRLVGDERGGPGTGPLIKFEFKDGTVGTLTERDLGAWDDIENTENPGIAVYPRVEGRPATQREIERSIELGSDPNEPEPESVKVETEAKPTVEMPVGCEDILVPISTSTMLSPNFKVGDFTHGPLRTHPLRSQHGLSQEQIVCNMRAVCVNILEPLAAKYGRNAINVTSGFRTADGRFSQHQVGQAVDIQFAGQYNGSLSKEAWWQIVLWVKDNIPFDQFIVEYLGNKPWLHLSYNPAGGRRKMNTAKKNGVKWQDGLHLI